jgi:hypothetical protein
MRWYVGLHEELNWLRRSQETQNPAEEQIVRIITQIAKSKARPNQLDPSAERRPALAPVARGVPVEVKDLVGDEVMIGCIDEDVDDGDFDVIGTIAVLPSDVAMIASCDGMTELATPLTKAV